MDNEITLELLNREYKTLLERINKVRKSILKISGVDPADESDLMVLDNKFPKKGNLKEKIKFILKENEFQQLTATQITILMMKYDPDISKQSVTQVCSNMGKTGEIGVVQGQKNLYYYATFNLKNNKMG